MFKTLTGRIKFFNVICAVLMLCLLILQFTPFWSYNGKTASISGYVWMPNDHSDLTSWFSAQLGSTVEIENVINVPILLLVLGAAGVIFCLAKSRSPIAALLPAACGIVGIYGCIAKPVFRLGTNWWIYLLLCIAMLAVAVVTIVFGFKERNSIQAGEVVLSSGDIAARVEKIRSLGSEKTSAGSDADQNFNRLLTYLTDEYAECRIAAAETLGQTARESAFTNISHELSKEKDPRVIQAMRKALTSIRENIRYEHTEQL